jgi:phosphoglycerate dehydrogenase-like enzyme
MIDDRPTPRGRTEKARHDETYSTDGGVEVLVRHQGAPSLAATDLRDALVRALPDRSVHLATTPADERALIPEATVLVGNELEPALLERAERLRLYAHASSGIDSLPLDELSARGIAVTNAAGLMPCISEQVLGYLLSHARGLRESLDRQQRREWRHFQPGELTGKTVTVVGMGAVGTQILERLEPFGVERVGVRHSPEKPGPAESIYGYPDLHEALSGADYVVLCCPLTETTTDLVGRTELDVLPNDAVLVNVARGRVVDTEALVWALHRNTVGGAALDVTSPEPLPDDHPLWGFENVVITPHNAGSSPGHWDRLASLLASNLDRVDRTGTYTDLRNQVVEP